MVEVQGRGREESKKENEKKAEWSWFESTAKKKLENVKWKWDWSHHDLFVLISIFISHRMLEIKSISEVNPLIQVHVLLILVSPKVPLQKNALIKVD